MTEFSTPSYAGTKVYCGFDVHKNSWSICPRTSGLNPTSFRMDADVDKVIEKLRKSYPGAEFHSVYEAGFCGFSAHRRLEAAGFHNIVVNPADVPTSGKERTFKSDDIDCRKLSKHLANGDLRGIDIPSEELERMRCIVRRETQLRDDATRCNNQLKGLLYYLGWSVPGVYLGARALEQLRLEAEAKRNETVLSLIRQLTFLREERAGVRKAEAALQKELGYAKAVENLSTIPGIAWRTATVLQAELGDVRRFPTRDHLASYVGVAPHLNGSGDKEKATASGSRKKKQLHYLLIQSAWVAAATDPLLRACFCRLCRGRTRTKAIVGVAKKLLLIVNAVLRSGLPYDSEKLEKMHPELARKLRESASKNKQAATLANAGKDDGQAPSAGPAPAAAPLPDPMIRSLSNEEDFLAEHGDVPDGDGHVDEKDRINRL